MDLKEKRLEKDKFFLSPQIVGGLLFLYLLQNNNYGFPIRRQTRC